MKSGVQTVTKIQVRALSLLLAVLLLLGAASPALMAISLLSDAFVLDGSPSAVYQLEDGDYTSSGVQVSTDVPGYDGAGYLTGFATAGSSVSFDVNVKTAGIYSLSLRSALYMENRALGRSSGQTSSHTQTSGNVTDGNPERGSYWGSGQPVTEDEPKWLQLDLGAVIPVHMVRIRIVTDWSARTQTFAVLGSTDGESFVTLKDTDVYSFSPAGKGNLAGNYADAVFEPAEIRYIRILFTGVSDQGTNGAQVGELEVYSPVRTAQLYLDDQLVSELSLKVDEQNIVDADWDTRVLEWAENEIGSLVLTAGEHRISIKNGGSLPGTLNLDRATFSFVAPLDNEAAEEIINSIAAIKPIYRITPSDAGDIMAVREAYEALGEDAKALVPAASIDKLNAAIRRLSLFGESAAITELVCNDSVNAGGWSVVEDLRPGDISHSDRTFTFSDVPYELWGCDWIRPAMESKRWNAQTTLLSFKSEVSTYLYVAWDSLAPRPDWLSDEAGFTKTSMTMSISNPDSTVFEIYRTSVEEGQTVSLGYLGMDKATYIVMLEHFTITESETQIEDTTEYPVIEIESVNDGSFDGAYVVSSGISENDKAFSDAGTVFTSVPEFIAGSTWIMPPSVQGKSDTGSILDIRVNRDGYLYLALPGAADDASVLDAGYEKTEASVEVGGEPYSLYRQRVDAGSAVSLPSLSEAEPSYIVIMKANTIASAPDVPAISRFLAPFDTDGWYFVRESLDVGSPLFTNNDTVVSALPDIYKGCDYIQTYCDDKTAIYFYAERDIEVALTIDSRFDVTPSWLLMWEDTGRTLEAGERSYNIFTNQYQAGEFITIPKLADTEYDNYIVIVRPLEDDYTPSDNPVVPEGQAAENDISYSYYANDVFNQEDDGSLPDDYTLVSGSAYIIPADKAERSDIAFRRHYSNSSARTEQFMDATDGNISTYWEASSDDTESFLDVDLGSVKNADTIVLMLNPSWGDRTQTFSVEVSKDGSEYTEILPSTDYLFAKESQNTVSISLPDGTEARRIRLVFSGNTGAPGAQVAEFKVYGDELSGVDKYIELSKVSDDDAVLVRSLSDGTASLSSRIIAEYEVRSSRADRKMYVSLRDSSGNDVVCLTFDTDGYLKATDGSGSAKICCYMPDTWYTVKLVVDTEEGTFDVWIDHTVRAQSLAVASGGAVSDVAFAVLEKNSALSIDNLRVYDNPEEYIFTEDFNSAEDIPDGWSFSVPGSAFIADVPFESDKSLMLSADGSAAKATRLLPETSGIFSFEVKVRIEGIGFAPMPVLTDSEGAVSAGVAFWHNSLYAVNGDNWVKVMDGASPWAYYPADNWYKIRLVVNTNTKRYDLYVDGALRMESLSFASDTSSVDRVCFTLGTDNTAYIDSLYMYMGSSLGEGLIDSANVIDVRDYGAVGDGVTDDTIAIQRALDDAAFTGKTVLLEDGVFLTSTIWVKSDTTLHIAPSAKILGIMEKNWYPLVESCEGLINYRQIGRGLVLTENASNVRIEGGGTIDGNGFYGYKVNDPATSRRLQDARPCVILSILSENVTISGVNLVNSAFWTLVPMESRNVTIRNVNVNSMNTPNRDGIDPCDVINLTIENCNILAGDDGLCFKSSSLFGCDNIDVRNITIQSRSNGIKFGSDTYGSLKNLYVSDVTMKNVVKSGITMQSADGAEIENLVFERITMTEVDDPIFLTVGNRGRQPVDNPGMRLGYIRNVEFTDISSESPMMPPYSYDSDVHEVLIIGLDEEHKIENVHFKNVTIEFPGGYTTVPGWPSGVGSGYPEHYSAKGKSNAWAYCIKYASNITFENCTNILLSDDVRPEITYYDGYSELPAEYDVNGEYVLPVRIQVEGTVSAEKLPLPETVGVLLENGEIAYLPVVWENYGGYISGVNGSYVVTGSIAETEGIGSTEGLCASAEVTVTGAEAAQKLSFTDSFEAYVQTRSESESLESVRLIIAANKDFMLGSSSLSVTVKFTTTDGGGKTHSGVLGNGNMDFPLFLQVTALGEVFEASDGNVLFGVVYTDVPTDQVESISVEIQNTEGEAVYNAAHQFT